MTYEEVFALLPSEGVVNLVLHAVTRPQPGLVKETHNAIISVMRDGLTRHHLSMVIEHPGDNRLQFFGTEVSEEVMGLRPTVVGSIRNYALLHIKSLSEVGE